MGGKVGIVASFCGLENLLSELCENEQKSNVFTSSARGIRKSFSG